MADESIRITQPMLMEIRASVLDEIDPQIRWSVGFAPELDDDGGRFVIANLRAAGPHGSVEVELAATQRGGGSAAVLDGEGAERFAEKLAAAEALQTLYEIARITAKGLLGTIDADHDLPLVSPPPEITQLVKSTEARREVGDAE